MRFVEIEGPNGTTQVNPDRVEMVEALGDSNAQLFIGGRRVMAHGTDREVCAKLTAPPLVAAPDVDLMFLTDCISKRLNGNGHEIDMDDAAGLATYLLGMGIVAHQHQDA